MIELDGARYRVVDAGIHRASRIQGMAETFSVERARWVLEQTDLTILVIDGTQGVTHQEQRLAEEIAESGSALIILLNKWDIADAEQGEPSRTSVIAWRSWRGLRCAESPRLAPGRMQRLGAAIAEVLAAPKCASRPLNSTDASSAGRRRIRHRLAAGRAVASVRRTGRYESTRRSSSSCAAADRTGLPPIPRKAGFASTARSLAHRYAW